MFEESLRKLGRKTFTENPVDFSDEKDNDIADTVDDKSKPIYSKRFGLKKYEIIPPEDQEVAELWKNEILLILEAIKNNDFDSLNSLMESKGKRFDFKKLLSRLEKEGGNLKADEQKLLAVALLGN